MTLTIRSTVSTLLLIVVAQVACISNASVDQIDEIVVTARQRAQAAGTLADTINQTEVVDFTAITNAQAAVLSDALQMTPGVRVNNECSMCGVKRVMLNGLGGQHTTFQIDGLPAHTLLSGFYGPDAMAMAGVERIEIARGAGASLTAPEAIGGVVNIIMMDPTKTGLRLNAAGGEEGYEQGDATATWVHDSGRARALLAGQYDTRDQFDVDNNGVSESPVLENTNYLLRVLVDPTEDSTLALGARHIDSQIAGGPTIGSSANSIKNAAFGSFKLDPTPSDVLFEGNDVRNRFIGKAWETTEWIETTRDEFSSNYFVALSPSLNLDVGGTYSEHSQDSFYEGFDYQADNDMWFWTGRLNWVINEQHLLTFGVDQRDETLKSSSTVAVGNPNYISDNFDYDTMAVFIQDTWMPNERLEIAFAVRLDAVKADFTDPQKPETEIDETVLLPRFDARYAHTDHYTSRLSAGQGYRAPLSFFETDHGILDAGLGFQIDVNDLERSNSINYALSYTGGRLTWTGTLAWSAVDDLAKLDDVEVDGELVPLLTQVDGTGDVYGATFELGYALTDNLNASIAAETFHRDSTARSIFAVAPAEERIWGELEWHPRDAWDIHLALTWIGPRDLTDYGYEGFNDVGVTLLKETDVDAYFVTDARVEYEVNELFSVYLGGRNLFDYTQTDDEDTPLFFDADGGYDVAYIYGPLRGREMYLGLTVLL